MPFECSTGATDGSDASGARRAGPRRPALAGPYGRRPAAAKRMGGVASAATRDCVADWRLPWGPSGRTISPARAMNRVSHARQGWNSGDESVTASVRNSQNYAIFHRGHAACLLRCGPHGRRASLRVRLSDGDACGGGSALGCNRHCDLEQVGAAGDERLHHPRGRARGLCTTGRDFVGRPIVNGVLNAGA